MNVLPGWGRPLCWLLLLLCWAPLAAAQPALTVHQIEVKHVGPPAVSDDLVRANIRVKEGDAYLRTTVDDDVRNLYSTGYFYNIRVGEQITPQGVVLTYVVQGKPKLTEIRFQGNTKFTRRKLLAKVTSKPGEPLNERKLFTDSQEILKLYQKAGYQKTQVKYTLNIDENAGQGTATFEITEAPKVKVERIDFVGAQAFPQKKLRKQLKTRGRWLFSWVTGSYVLKDEQFDEDKERLAAFYREHGYIDFELRDVQFEPLKPNRLLVRFIVSEGIQYKVGAVQFKGNALFTAEQLRAGATILGREVRPRMLEGEIFRPRGLAQDLEALQDLYGSKGYIDAQIRAIKTPNILTGTMDLVYQIEEQQQSFIEKIEIKGNIKTKDKVIRRELAVSPGEVFDMTRVKLSRRRLEGLQYFEKVDAQPEPTEVPNRRNLVVGVEEKSTGNLAVGAGFSSVDQIVGFIEVSQGNFDLFNPPYFTGGGHKARLRAQIGTRRQDYQLTFIEPWFLDRKLELSVDLYHRDLQFQSSLYDEQRTGGRIGLRRALGTDFLIGSVSYTLERLAFDLGRDARGPSLVREPLPGRGDLIRVDPGNVPSDILREQRDSLISSVGASLAWDTRNSVLLPDRGQRTELSTEVATDYLGGERNYYKLELRSSWYFKGLASGHVLEAVGRIGVADGFSGDDIPFYERFYLGGLYSLRGFDYRDISPREPGFVEPIGGRTYWFGSLEYSVPIIERLRFAVFYDVGMVYEDAYSFSTTADRNNYYDNWGIGLRLNLPIGPLRLDYGIPINSDRFTGDSGKFQFGVGYTREF